MRRKTGEGPLYFTTHQAGVYHVPLTDTMATRKPEFLTDLNLDQFKQWASEHGLPEYRASQVFEWVFQHKAADYAQMTNIPMRLREQLARELPLFATSIVREQVSSDGTIKLLIQLSDGETVESVMIPEDKRRTVCISSQVGCGMGCIFCASGLFGMKRQLSDEHTLLLRFDGDFAAVSGKTGGAEPAIEFTTIREAQP